MQNKLPAAFFLVISAISLTKSEETCKPANDFKGAALEFQNMDVPPQNLKLKYPQTIRTNIILMDISNFNEKDMDFRIDYFLIHRWRVAPPWCNCYVKTVRKNGVSIDNATVLEILANEAANEKAAKEKKSAEESNSTDASEENQEKRDVVKEVGQKHVRLNGTAKLKIIVEDPLFNDLFWWPDTFMSTAKGESRASSVVDTRYMVLTRNPKTRNCELTYFARLAAKVSCQFSLMDYPKDLQVCPLVFRSCESLIFLLIS